jgi:DNA-binding XRE family transcriptional regulator
LNPAFITTEMRQEHLKKIAEITEQAISQINQGEENETQ